MRCRWKDVRRTETPVRLLIHDTEIRIITADGELLKELTLDPDHDYQPQ